MREYEKDRLGRIPCMYNHTKACVDCKLYAINLLNIRKLSQNIEFKNIFSRYIGEYPTPKQVAQLLFNYEDVVAKIDTNYFGKGHIIPKEIAELISGIAEKRRVYVINRFSKFNDEDYAFSVKCPNLRSKA